MTIFEEIQSLTDSKKYDEAIKIINKHLEASSDVALEDERFYAALLQKRVSINDKLDKIDDEINAVVRTKVYPSEEVFNIVGGPEVKLIYQNLLTQHLDAFVTTIHQSKFFEFSERGASADLIKKLGKESIRNQIPKKMDFEKGDFLLLSHKELKTPLSYHILYYQSDRVLDLPTLEKGIIKVLEKIKQMGLKKIGFFALGFYEVLTAEEKFKKSVAETISDKIAETLTNYFYENSKGTIQQIRFGFVNHITMQTFSRAFYRWSKMKSKDFIAIKEYSEREKQFIKDVKVQNEKFLNDLRRFSTLFNDKTPLLLLGETGVGKSYIAQQIHKFSNRRSLPFVEENCAMLRPENAETKLFGWKKGAYTDAREDGKGAIELAEKGTLFLDEIGTTEHRVQSMLLKYLDKGEYQRYGERDQDRKADVRLIFGTNADLIEEIEKNSFRKDLFERISVASITIPPLRERVEDIILFVEEFLLKLNTDKKSTIDIDERAIEHLKQFEWPGNIRQLKAYIENLYNECIFGKKTRITDRLIKDNPPRNEVYKKKNALYNLELALRELITSWNPSYGKINENILEPVLSKIYLKDLGLLKTNASKIIGIDGTRGERSTLDKRFESYDEIIKKIFDK